MGLPVFAVTFRYRIIRFPPNPNQSPLIRQERLMRPQKTAGKSASSALENALFPFIYKIEKAENPA